MVRLEPNTTKNDEGREFPFAALPDLRHLLERQRERTRALEKKTGRIIPWVFHRSGERIRASNGFAAGLLAGVVVPVSDAAAGEGGVGAYLLSFGDLESDVRMVPGSESSGRALPPDSSGTSRLERPHVSVRSETSRSVRRARRAGSMVDTSVNPSTPRATVPKTTGS